MTATPASEEGVLVGTGSFLVDRKKALDKLMRFQLPNPAGFPLLWLRCAAASGATLFSIERQGSVLVVRFDGRPLRREDLADPYRWLFERTSPGTARNRMLAAGLLSALGMKPSLLRVSSGKGAARIALRVYSLEREEFETSAPGRETVIEAGIGGAAREAARLVREGCGLSNLKVTVEGDVQPDWQSGSHRWTFQEGTAYGWVAAPLTSEDDPLHHQRVRRLVSDKWSTWLLGSDRLVPERGRDVNLVNDKWITLNVTQPAIVTQTAMKDSFVKLYSQGVLIERLSLRLPIAPVVASINDDSFVLNASQSGVVRDDAFRQAIQRLDEPMRELIRSEAAALAECLPAIARRLDETRIRRVWRKTLEPEESRDVTFGSAVKTTLSLLPSVGRRPPKDYLRRVEETARVVQWLANIAAGSSLLNSTRDAAVLRAAPLFTGVDGGMLSLSDLADEVQKRSYLPYSFQPAWGAALGFRALWAIWAGEEAFASQLLGGARTRDMTAGIKRHQTAANDPHSATFEQAGLPAPLIRSELHAAEYFGEVGLLAALPVQGQLHLLTEGIPSGLLEEGTLRFTAIVTGPNHRWDSVPLTIDIASRHLFAVARAEAERLYPKLAEELDPADSSASGIGIRAHLLDFLANELQTRGTDAVSGSAPSWIANLPLFLTPDGASSWTQIIARVEKGEIVYAALQRPDHAPHHGFWVMAPHFDEGLLARLFPRNTLVPAAPDVLAVLRQPSVSCRPADGICAFAFRAGVNIFHAACSDKRFSWKTATLHAVESADDIAIDLSGHEELVIQLMTALIRQAGTLHDRPDHPLRRLLMKLLALQPPPWRPAAAQELWESVRGRLFFRGGAEGWMLEDIYAALQDPSARLTYSANASVAADLILNEDELQALRSTAATVQLVPYGELDLSLPVVEPSEPLEEDPAPTYKTIDIARSERPMRSSSRVGFRGTKLISPKDRLFIERRYQAFGLDVWLGIPVRHPPPKPAFVPGDKAAFEISLVPPLAHVLVDAAEWAKTSPVPALPVLIDMLQSLYNDLADCWPVVHPGGQHFAVIRRYVLEAAGLAGRDDRFIAWGPLREMLLKLPLFWTDGRWTSVGELDQSSRTEGALQYADLKRPTQAQRRLIEEILGGVVYKKTKDAPGTAAVTAVTRAVLRTKPAPSDKPVRSAAPRNVASFVSTRPGWMQGAPDQSSAIDLAFRLLVALHGRKGLRLPHGRILKVWSLVLGQNLLHSPLTINKRTWILDEQHPLVTTILKSPLSPEQQAPYLASIAFTAANRLMSQVTDEDDIRFQEALTTLLAPRADATQR